MIYHELGTCKTLDGNACIFPFKYKNVDQLKCVWVGNQGKPWCIWKYNKDGSYDWGDCDMSTCGGQGWYYHHVEI